MSGAAWLPRLPDNWEAVQMRRVATFRNGADYKDVEVDSGGFPVYGSGGEFRRASEYLYDGTSVLFGRKGTINRPLLVSGKFWTVDTIFYTELRSTVEPRFLHYYATTMPFEYYSTNTALPSMTQGELGGHRMPLPPLDEQRAIADYLDHETAQIDELIAEQQHLIDLLAERRQAIAASVLGARVGAGKRLKWVLTESDVRAGERAADLPMMSVSITWGVRRRDEVTGDDTRAEELSHYKVCSQGDLVVNRMRAFQGALGLAPEDGLVSPDYAVLNVRPDVDAGWLAAAMKTPSFVAEMAQRVKGIGSADLGNARTPRINVADLGEIRVDVPDVDRQVDQRADVQVQSERIDRLVLEAELFIKFARERRSALITAAVTGQIDVRTAAA